MFFRAVEGRCIFIYITISHCDSSFFNRADIWLSSSSCVINLEITSKWGKKHRFSLKLLVELKSLNHFLINPFCPCSTDILIDLSRHHMAKMVKLHF